MRIVCGWCHHATPPGLCDYCGRGAAVPWVQRGLSAPSADQTQGLDAKGIRLLYDEARTALVAAGHVPTTEAIAEKLDRSPRTVRLWKARFGL